MSTNYRKRESRWSGIPGISVTIPIFLSQVEQPITPNGVIIITGQKFAGYFDLDMGF